jgi:rhodanese-related sulfurtransferase
MAPLVPEFISPEFNLVIALIVGIGFGYALEQAGFSSSRKLVGLFYGYDFTVLKVFFTAGITAMTGVLLLGHLGLLNLEMLYINPTFLYSAIIGGLIMGAGFIMGGFCPGTSLCAAAVGRLDAMAFIGGSLFGILFFMEAFPLFEPIFVAEYMGALTFYEVLNISPELFGVILTLVALGAFYATSKLEDHINNTKTDVPKNRTWIYTGLGVVPLLLIALVWLTPSKKEYVRNLVDEQAKSGDVQIETMDIDELAFELVNHNHKYNLIDVRDTSAFRETIPTAINIPYGEIDSEAWTDLYKQPYKKNIFIGDSGENVLKAGIMAKILGDDDPVILDASVVEFRNTIYTPEQPAADAPKHDRDVYRFRNNARMDLIRIEERLKNLQQPVKKEVKRVEGGCT